MPTRTIRIANELIAGDDRPLLLIAGPDLVEDRDHALRMAESLSSVAAKRSVPFVYKSSFDKANRTSVDSPRGPGLEEGLRILQDVKRETGVALTTDVHSVEQVPSVAEVCDLIQIPAFLCRQTDLLLAAGQTGKAVNVKKGQFLAADDTRHIVAKLRSTGNDQIMLTERGTTHGYHNLVVDFRSLPQMAAFDVPVCFDATHSVQLPGAAGGSSGGERQYIPILARAAVAIGVDALFFEVHDDPANAPCDGPNQWPLSRFSGLLDRLIAIDNASRR
ncbi:MAG: 3-deoxy-8-phosphooctulonate synthase [Acidobacteriota bacterium]|nr:3-deoxy-8-phosphooctulonate synthase [Acidobacteriota bacterium]MDH3784479.1 3-deoxy-8-phosphooctulonate synthase [Acidobacteriota bacterium]